MTKRHQHSHPDHFIEYKNVIKSTGEIEPFSTKKLRRSLRRTGLRPKFCNAIASEVEEKCHPGIKTKEIFKHTYNLIKKQSPVAATRYTLKKSILELGPAGFVFECFVAKYFEAIGFETKTGIIMQGQYVRHEVDVVAFKKNYHVNVECKFHNNVARKNDIKTALYVKARWDDLKNGPEGKYLRGYYLASNTSFTSDAIEYSLGCGLQLLGVNAPADESFLDKIKKLKLYPITSLKRLKKIHCEELLREKIILCTDLLNAKETMFKIGMKEEEIRNIFKDINRILE